MSFQKFMEQHMQLHTVRIELKGGRCLIYQVDSYRKEELETWMRNPVESFDGLTSSFLSFYSDYDRIVFVRISSIHRIIFCWDIAATVADPTAYSDPFNILQPNNFDDDAETLADGTLAHGGELPEWLRGLGLEEEGTGQADDVEGIPLIEMPGDTDGMPEAFIPEQLQWPDEEIETPGFENENDGEPWTDNEEKSMADGRTELTTFLEQLELDSSLVQQQNAAGGDDLVFDDMEETDIPDIPDAIVLLSSLAEPLLYYDLDEEVDAIPFNMESGFSSMSIAGRFLSFTDADGENNYMPVENIVCLDVSRRLVFDELAWQEIERSRWLDENMN